MPLESFLSRISLVEYSSYSGFVKSLVAGAVHEQVCFEPCYITVVVEEVTTNRLCDLWAKHHVCVL
jgi:hypothetical protein